MRYHRLLSILLYYNACATRRFQTIFLTLLRIFIRYLHATFAALPFCLVSGSRFSLVQHWKCVRDNFTENYKNDLVWLITLRAVKVRDSLRSWGYISTSRYLYATFAALPFCLVSGSRLFLDVFLWFSIGNVFVIISPKTITMTSSG